MSGFVYHPSCKNNNAKEPDTTETDTGTETNQNSEVSGFTVFDGTGYPSKIVYPTGESELAISLADAMEQRFGVKPEKQTDLASASDPAAVEILLGATNRSESTPLTDEEAKDAWWYFVGVVGNKLVINGSNSYMLELAVEHFNSDTLALAQGNTLVLAAEQNVISKLEGYSAEGWLLNDLPSYEGENPFYGLTVYESGKPLSTFHDSNTQMSKEVVISRTSETEFLSYVERLKTVGFEQTEYEEIDKNIYVTLTNGSYQVYTYLTANKRMASIIIDYASDSVDGISKPMTAEQIAAAKESGNSAIFYQYGLNQTGLEMPETGMNDYQNNGMMYVIKCADNSVIIVDGGYSGQTDYARLNDFLHEITGTAAGEKVTIASWVLTHLHGDHYAGFLAFLNDYHAQCDLQSICANVPYAIAMEASSSAISAMKTFATKLKGWYPECKELQIHTGQKLQFGDVTLQALYTHEDFLTVGTEGNTLVGGDFNNTSVTFKVWTDDMSMILLGDAQGKVEDGMLSVYSETTLNCDIVQIAHHALNGCTRIYDYTKASIYFVPQSYGGFQRTLPVDEFKWDTLIRRELLEGKIWPTYAQGYGTSEEMIFYAGKVELTVGLQVVDGKITIVDEPEGAANRSPSEDMVAKEDTETQWGDIELIK